MAGRSRRVGLGFVTIGRWRRRARVLAGLLSAVVVVSTVAVAPPTPAQADPGRPPAGSPTKPRQGTRTVGVDSHEASAASTSVPGAVGVVPARGRVPGAVGPEPVYPPVRVPGLEQAEQRVSEMQQFGRAQGFVAGRSVESTGSRTERSTEFANPDGTKTLRIYDGVAFVPDGAGGMRPLDNRLSRRADGRWAPAAAAPVTLAGSAADAQVATVEDGSDASVGFAVDGAAAVAPTVAGATATYPEVRPDADLKLTPMEWGFKEDIVLRSADAPTSWLFPLKVRGVTPSLDEASGAVVFTDAAGAVRGSIPPGFMEDSNIHPRRGSGERSDNVRYALVRDGDGWALRVDLDRAWLADPARVYPVIVDPTYVDKAETDDTFVSKKDYANRNNSGSSDLLVGTYNGGTERAASYLHFNNLKAALPNRYVLGASLNMWNYWSYSCRARPVNVYAVTKSWAGSTTTTWAGPAYDSGSRLATASFANGYYDCPSGGWAELELPYERVTRWLHGTEAFYGITVRASETDSYGWKRFASANSTNTAARPYIDLNYSDYGAKSTLPSASFNPPVTAGTAGRTTVRVTNWGSNTWTPTNGYRLHYKIYNSAGTSVVRNGPFYAMPKNVGPHQYADVPIQVEALPLGSYKLRVDMVNPATTTFNTAYGSTYSQSDFTVRNGAPTIGEGGVFPAHNGYTDTLTPTLWADYWDPDNTPAGGRQLKFKICKGAPSAPSNCQTTAWQSATNWSVPAGLLEWHEPAHWYVTLSDTSASTGELGPYVFTPTVAQPEVTSHLASAPAGADAPGLNPYAGNYSTAVTDAAVAVAGPTLALTRTYNSQDLRASGAFGAGWASPVDQRIVTDSDGSGNVVLTLASGGQLRFGRNPDGSYAPPAGTNLTLVAAGTPTVWTLRDASGVRRLFTEQGLLSSVVDPDGRTQTYGYNPAGELAEITDVASGRALHLGWTGGHVTSVSTDPPGAGQPAPTWTYTYDGDRLTGVCSPLSAQSCTSYAYAASSHYRSVVTDDNPAGYWPLGEAADASDAANVVATKTGERDGAYNDVTPGVPGALPGSPDTAVDFGASASSAVTLPTNLVNTSLGMAVELWFKADAGEQGVLFGMQNTDLTATPNHYTPVLYVGTDGRLRSKIWTLGSNGTTQMTSTGRVDDGQWHHAVVSGAVNAQQLYLDGTRVGQLTGYTIDHLDLAYAAIGNARTTTNWPAAVNGYFPFTGHIDETAFYLHPLGPTQVAAHWAARTPTWRLTTATEPGGHTALQVGYDGPSGRVTTVTDRHGSAWDLGAPTPENGKRVVVLSPDNAEPITYRHDMKRSGVLVSRTDTFGEQTWTYNTRGFVATHTDANGNTTSYDTDQRGNILAETKCRTTAQCLTSYAGFYLNAADPLDPRNDVRVWTADPRSASATDTTYRTTNTIDALGRVTTITYPTPSGHTTNPTEAFTYSTGTEAAEPAGTGPIPAGLLLTATGRNGTTTRHFYNTAGDLVRTVDPVGLTTTHTYDALGRIASTTTGPATGDNYGTTTYTYNAASLPATATAPAITNPVTGTTHQARTTFGYDPAGRRTSQAITDLTGGAPARTWTFTYDPGGRPDTTTAPDGAVTDHDYDTRGDLVREARPGGLVLEHTYDSLHRRTETAAVGAGVDPMNPAETRLVVDSRAYDPAGRLATVVDAMGRETGYTYYGDNLLATTSRVRRNADGDITSQTQLESLDYNAAGQVNRRTTLGGIVTTSVYDPAGYVTEDHLDPTGLNRATVYTRNIDGTVATATRTGTASPGRSEATSYTYDDAGRILTETVTNTGGSPATLTTTHVRDARGLPTQTTDPAGVTTRYGYDNAGNPTTTTGHARTVWAGGTSATAEPVTTVGYNTFGEPTHQRDPNGAVTTTDVDPAGRPVALTLPTYTPPGGVAVAPTSHSVYNAQGLVERVTDPLGRATTYTYNPHGSVLTKTLPDPDGDGPKTAPVYSYSYDRVGELLNTTDPTGGQNSATYDDLGRQITATVTDRVSGATSYLTTGLGYDAAGNLATITSPRGNTITTTYNTAGEPLKTTDPSDRFTQYTYDLAGRTLTTVKGKGTTYVDPVTTHTYDLAGRQTAQADCTTTTTGTCGTTLRTTTATYNGAGQPLTVTSGEGRPTSYGYDPAGQLTTITGRTNPTNAATAITVQLGYDPAGQRTRMVDGNGNPTTYTYTPWGQTASVIEPATPTHPEAADRTWTTGYDAAGQPVTHHLPGGVTRTLTYDRLGNLTSETGTGAETTTATRQLDYDPLGRITTVGGPTGATTYTWNDRALLTSATGAAGNAAYTYDADSNPTSRTDTTGTTTFTYNAAGMLSTLTDPLTGTTATHTYKNNGNIGQITYGSGGPTRTYTYDNLARPATDTYKNPAGTTTASATYSYDRDDQLTSKTTTGVAGAGTHTYGYDGLNRLTTWTKPGNTTTSYGYDPASNRTTVTDPTGTRTTTYDARNRPTTATGAGQPTETWTWTPRGTQATHVSGTTTDSYAFDAFERLNSATNSGTTVTYTYDALDRLAQRNGTALLYNDQTNNPVRAPNPAGTDTHILRGIDGQPLADKAGTAAARSLITDGIHSDVVAATNPTTGALAASATYQPYGGTTATTGTLPLGYQGGWTDPNTGQVNAHARWHNPGTGTFTSRDTWTLPPDPITQTNRYTYANANPTNGTDPTGHYWDPGGGAAPGIIGAGTGVGILAGAGGAGAAAAAGAACAVGCLIAIGFVGWVAITGAVAYGGYKAGEYIRNEWIAPAGRGGVRASPRTTTRPPRTPPVPCYLYPASCGPLPPPGGDDGDGDGERCTRNCGQPPRTPPCVLASIAAGLSNSVLCRIPWLLDVKPPPRHIGNQRPASESLTPGGVIGNNPNNQPPPQINSDDTGESAPNAAGPAQAQLDDACYTGGWQRSDGTRSAIYWRDGCGVQPGDLFDEFGITPGTALKRGMSGPGDRTFITYAFVKAGGDVTRAADVTYVGRASGVGTPEQVLTGRLARGHDHYGNGLIPQVIAVQRSYAANRGAEEFYIQAYLQRGARLTNVDPAVGFSRRERGAKSVGYVDAFFRELLEG